MTESTPFASRGDWRITGFVFNPVLLPFRSASKSYWLVLRPIQQVVEIEVVVLGWGYADMTENNTNGPDKQSESLVSEAQARRDFLKKAGRFATVTPPSITLLLGTSLNSKAIAKSGGSSPGSGGGGQESHSPPPHRKVYGFGRGNGGQSDSYGGGSHGGSSSGDPN